MQKTIYILLFTLIGNLCFGQNIKPIDLAKKLLNKEVFENLEKYSTGEFKGHPNGQDLSENVKLNFRLLNQSENTAVVNITIKDSIGKGFDAYLHFKKDSIWKINAFRALAMTGILEQIKNEFEKMSESEIDSLIISEKDSEHKMFETKDDFQFQLENIKLTLEFDDNIINHFKENQMEFERLKDLALKELETKKKDDERSSKLLGDLNSEYKKILISSISTGGYQLGNCIEFLIGGMVDNTVGYFYLKEEQDLPKMNPSRIIMIRKIGNGWYMYKTT